MIERALAYDIRLDERKPVNGAFIKRQAETHIGERLNVLLSRTRYDLKDDQIFAEGDSEPFIDVLRRGRDYRREHGEEVDFAREDAEVTGFLKMQDVLGNPATLIGTMMLSISPRGSEESSYQHNYYDVLRLSRDEKGRFIEARRYSSALTYEEYAKFLGLNFVPSDAYFLSNPIRFYSKHITNPDEIHALFHKEHNYLGEDDFNLILQVCRPFVMAYIEALSQTDDKMLHALAFNAILNRADRARMDLELIKSGKLTYIDDSAATANSYQVSRWGRLPVREIMTGCGASGGADLGNYPFSVSEFGLSKDNYGDRTFDCPDCGRKNVRPENQLLKNCQRCGSSKVAC